MISGARANRPALAAALGADEVMTSEGKHPRAGSLKLAVTPNERQKSKAKHAVELCLLALKERKRVNKTTNKKEDDRIFLTRQNLKDFTGIEKLHKDLIEAFCAGMLQEGWTMAPTQKVFHTSEDWLLLRLGRSRDFANRSYLSDKEINIARNMLEEQRR